MMGRDKGRGQMDLFVAGSLDRLIPEDHVLKRVDHVLDLSWLREEVADCYCLDNGRPGIDPEVALRLMLAGMLLGYVHDRRLLREAQAHLAVRWFIGIGLHEDLPDHSSLTRIRQRWGAARFKRIFRRTVQACLDAGVAKGEVVHVDASLIRADVSWASLGERHAADVLRENPGEEDVGRKGKGRRGGGSGKVSRTDPDARLARKKRSGGVRAELQAPRGGGRCAGCCSRRGGDGGDVERAGDDGAPSGGGRGVVGPRAGDGDGGFGVCVLEGLWRIGASGGGWADTGEAGTRAEPGTDEPVPLRRAPRRGEVSAGEEADPPGGDGAWALLWFEDARLRGLRAQVRLSAEVANEQGGADSPGVSGAVARAGVGMRGGGRRSVGCGAGTWVARRATTPRRRAGTDWGGRCAGALRTCGSRPT